MTENWPSWIKGETCLISIALLSGIVFWGFPEYPKNANIYTCTVKSFSSRSTVEEFFSFFHTILVCSRRFSSSLSPSLSLARFLPFSLSLLFFLFVLTLLNTSLALHIYNERSKKKKEGHTIYALRKKYCGFFSCIFSASHIRRSCCRCHY